MAFEVPDFQTPFQIQQRAENLAADTNLKNVTSAFHKAQTDQIRDNMDTQNAEAEALARTAKGFKSDTLTMPGAGKPEVGALIKGADGNFYVTGVDSPMASWQQATGKDSADAAALRQAFSDWQQSKAMLDGLADARKFKPATFKEYQNNERAAFKTFAEAQQKAFDAAKAETGAIQNELASVALADPKDRPAVLANAINNAMTKHGRETITKALMGAGLIAPNGQVVYNPIAIDSLQKSLLTAQQQVEEKERMFRKDLDLQKFEEQKKEFKISSSQRDSEIYQNRQRFLLDAGVKDPAASGQKVNDDHLKNPAVEVLPTLEAQNNNMRRILGSIVKNGEIPAGSYTKVSEADRLAMIRSYQSALDALNRHGAVAYNDKTVKDFRGAIERSINYLGSVGKGDVTINNRTMKDIAVAHDEVTKAMNLIAVKSSVTAMDQAKGLASQYSNLLSPKERGTVDAGAAATSQVKWVGDLRAAVSRGEAKLGALSADGKYRSVQFTHDPTKWYEVPLDQAQ